MFDAMGKLIVHAGPLGQGQIVKVISNAVSATNAAALGQALVVGARAGVDLDALVEVMAAGSGGSTMLNLKAGPMRSTTTRRCSSLITCSRTSGSAWRRARPPGCRSRSRR